MRSSVYIGQSPASHQSGPQIWWVHSSQTSYEPVLSWAPQSCPLETLSLIWTKKRRRRQGRVCCNVLHLFSLLAFHFRGRCGNILRQGTGPGRIPDLDPNFLQRMNIFLLIIHQHDINNETGSWRRRATFWKPYGALQWASSLLSISSSEHLSLQCAKDHFKYFLIAQGCRAFDHLLSVHHWSPDVLLSASSMHCWDILLQLIYRAIVIDW